MEQRIKENSTVPMPSDQNTTHSSVLQKKSKTAVDQFLQDDGFEPVRPTITGSAGVYTESENESLALASRSAASGHQYYPQQQANA